jgi:CubicO group peptidase (beta-lactamase class C family)
MVKRVDFYFIMDWKWVLGLLWFVPMGLFAQVATVETIYDKMSMEERAALLFINVSQESHPSVYKPGGTVFKSLTSVPQQSTHKAFRLIDVANGCADGHDLDFPGVQVVRTAGDVSETERLHLDFLQLHPHISGVITGYLPHFDSYLGLSWDRPRPMNMLLLRNDSEVKGLKMSQLIVAGLIRFPVKIMPESKRVDVHGVREVPLQGSIISQPWENRFDTISQLDFTLEEVLQYPFLFETQNIADDVKKLVRAVNGGLVSKRAFEERVMWVLKIQNRQQPLTVKTELPVKSNLRLRQKFFERSLCLVRNNDNLVPLAMEPQAHLFYDLRSVKKGELADISWLHNRFAKWPKVNIASLKFDEIPSAIHVVLLDDIALLPKVTTQVWKLKSVTPNAKVMLVVLDDNMVAKYVINDYSCFSSVILGYESMPFLWECALQGLYGGISLNGTSMYNLPGLSLKGNVAATVKCRFKLGKPAEVMMDASVLKKIDGIMTDAIEGGAIPGGQVLVARDGVVVYRKSFGRLSDANSKRVETTDLYDIASLTKIMASVPALMHLYDKGKFRVDVPLKTYLPETAETNKGELLVSEILTHRAGISPYIPFHFNAIDRSKLAGNLFSNKRSAQFPVQLDDRLFLNKTAVFRSDVFSAIATPDFSVQVAKNFYMNRNYIDSMYTQILTSRVNELKPYRYSDLGYYLFQRIIEKVEDQKLDAVMDSLFYRRMGTMGLTYLPLNSFPADIIAPTEKEMAFRKQMLVGYVHDAGAAMMGGVAGHAGLFASADDVAKMMQMYLNEGSYGGIHFLKPETVQLFTRSNSPGNRRGLGFDKPATDSSSISPVNKEASPSSFGHLGFTGTLAWADPEKRLVVVFLSNRVYPRSWNKKLTEGKYRMKVMEAAYQSILPEPGKK